MPTTVVSVAAGPREQVARWALPIAVAAFYALTAHGYGVFRDELYYFACARHLDWGYVDQPPLIAMFAAGVRAVAGPSWIAARLLIALAAGATALVVGDTAGVLGGGRFARLLAQILTAVTPVYLALFSYFSMNAFDVLVWAGLASIAARALGGGDTRLWLAFGTLAGVGLENKIDVAVLGAGLAAGLLAARRFDVLRDRRLWIGGAIAGALVLPHLVWQQAHGWPTREFIHNAQSGKITILGPLGFIAAQFQMAGPVGFALALAGLGWLLGAPRARPFRPLGWAAIVVFAVFAFSISKPYYFAPALTLLFPAAGAALEAWSRGRFERPLRAATLLAAAAILFAAPLVKPLLPEDTYVRYATRLGVGLGSDENHRLGRLPQFFADMHGWREMAEAVGKVAASLPSADRAVACVYGQNYGEAAAVDFYRREFDLPPAISGHNSYWLWGPGRCTGQVLIIIGGERSDHLRSFASVEPGGTFRCDDCMPYESDLTLWVARGLRAPIDEAWARSKHYD